MHILRIKMYFALPRCKSHNLEHLQDQRNPMKEYHKRIKYAPTVFEVAIGFLEQASDVHLDNHLCGEKKGDNHVCNKGGKLKEWVSLERAWGVYTNGNKGSQCT